VRPVLCAVSHRQRLAPPDARADATATLVEYVAAAGRAGIDLVQLRERDLEGGAYARLVRRCVDVLRGSSTRLIVNDRLDVALAGGAHGLHLPGHGVPAPRVRAVVPRGFLIGRSVHHASEAARVATEGGVDYLVFGTVFQTSSKPEVAPAGTRGLSAAVAAVSLPVLAIGGITPQRMRDVAETGAAGVAAIGVFAEAWSRGEQPLRDVVAHLVRSYERT
jgi:thiamine-phosphate diphosphorylase